MLSVPIQFSAKFELVINMKTARAMLTTKPASTPGAFSRARNQPICRSSKC